MDDISDNDEDLPVAAALDPRFWQGLQATWVSVRNVEKYNACPNEACYMKKLINNICPLCNTLHSDDDMAPRWTASFGFVLESFNTCGQSVHSRNDVSFSKVRPGCAFPDEAEEV